MEDDEEEKDSKGSNFIKCLISRRESSTDNVLQSVDTFLGNAVEVLISV